MRFVVLGVGNDLRGDDAAGILAARSLAGHFAGNDAVLVLACGPAPENFTKPIRTFDPDVLIYIDAAEMGKSPGSVQVVTADGLAAVTPSTHTWSPVMLFDYLRLETGCQCILLAVHVGDARLGQSISAEVAAAVAEVSEGLVGVLSSLLGG